MGDTDTESLRGVRSDRAWVSRSSASRDDSEKDGRAHLSFSDSTDIACADATAVAKRNDAALRAS